MRICSSLMETYSSDLKTNFFPLSELQTLCVGDATINNLPHSLKAFLAKLGEHEVTELDVFAGLIYILAVECGYSWNTVDTSGYQLNHSFDVRQMNAIPSSAYIPAETNNDEIKFIIYLAGCEAFKCTLLMKRIATKVVVNLSTTSPLLCFSQAYNMSNYVNKKEITFSSLPELSKSSKDELFYKMKCHIFYHNDIKLVASLYGLPPEIILYMIEYLNAGDFLNLCKTNQYFYQSYYKDDNIWKYFCKKYKYDPINSPTSTFCWKSHFFRETVRNRRKHLIIFNKDNIA